jgi:hypothetical protein
VRVHGSERQPKRQWPLCHKLPRRGSGHGGQSQAIQLASAHTEAAPIKTVGTGVGSLQLDGEEFSKRKDRLLRLPAHHTTAVKGGFAPNCARSSYETVEHERALHQPESPCC